MLDKAALLWDTQVLADHEEDANIRQGLLAYASRQAQARRDLAETFRKLWDLPITAVAQYTLDANPAEDELVIPMPEASNTNDWEGSDSDDTDLDAELVASDSDSDNE